MFECFVAGIDQMMMRMKKMAMKTKMMKKPSEKLARLELKKAVRKKIMNT